MVLYGKFYIVTGAAVLVVSQYGHQWNDIKVRPGVYEGRCMLFTLAVFFAATSIASCACPSLMLSTIVLCWAGRTSAVVRNPFVFFLRRSIQLPSYCLKLASFMSCTIHRSLIIESFASYNPSYLDCVQIVSK